MLFFISFKRYVYLIYILFTTFLLKFRFEFEIYTKDYLLELFITLLRNFCWL